MTRDGDRGSDRSTPPTTPTTSPRRLSPRRRASWRAQSARAPTCRSTPSPARAEDTQTGRGLSVAGALPDLDPEEAARQAVERSIRMLGAVKIPSARLTAVFDPRVTATLLSVIGAGLCGEAVVKGRSFFADRVGELVASSRSPWSTTRPCPGLQRSGYRRRGPRVSAQRPHRRGPAAGLRLRHRLGSPGRNRLDRSAVRGGIAGSPQRRLPGAAARARASTSPRRSWPWWATASSWSRSPGVHSGVSPVTGDFSVGADGSHDPRRRARRAGARGHRRLDAPAMLLDMPPSARTWTGCPAWPPVRRSRSARCSSRGANPRSTSSSSC